MPGNLSKSNPRKLWSRVLTVLLSGLLISLMLSAKIRELNEERLQEALSRQAYDLASQVEQRIRLYQYGLRGMRGAIVTAGDDLNRELVIRYSTTRDVDLEFPGARGFGFIRRVAVADEAGFIQAARSDDWPEFNIRQLSPHAGERFVIQYIEPVGRNLAAVGLDIASETNRREAAWSSLLSGEVRLTGPITLVQATGSPQQSFLILMPVYRGGKTPQTQAGREQLGFGWSYAPLLMAEVMADLRLHQDQLALEIIDMTDVQQPVSFFNNQTSAGFAHVAGYQIDRSIFGRQWQFRFRAYSSFVQALNLPSPVMVFALGSVISVLISALLAMLFNSRLRRKEYLAQQARLASIVESSADGIISQDGNGNVRSWNPAAARMFGITEADALGRPLSALIIPPELQDEEYAVCAAVSQGSCLLPKEGVRSRADGTLLDVSVSYAVIRDMEGKAVGISESIRDITGQKTAQAKIIELNTNLERQVEERAGEAQRLSQLLQGVLDSASEVSIIATDKEGIVTLFNQGAERMLGYRAEEFVGVQSPAVLHAVEEVEARSFELEREYGGHIRGFRVFVHRSEREGAETREWTYIRKNGQRLLVSLSVTTMRDSAGEIVGYLGIAVDISARKASEAALEKSLMTTQAILNTAVNPIITIDSFGVIRSFNPAGEQTFGYRGEDVVGKNIRMLMPEPFASRHDLYMQRFREMSSERVIGINREIQARRKDGSIFPVQISLGAMNLRGERIVVGIMTDISQQRAQHEALAATTAQLAMAADVAELGVWSWTPENNELLWNDRMFELYQQPLSLRSHGLNYEHWRMRIHPDDRARTEGALQAAVEGRGVYDPVFRIVLPDGRERSIQAGAQVERAEDGTLLRVTGINRDITEQLEYETRLREAKETADAASAAKSTFLANMSHEIRTPMNAVMGMLKLVAQTNLNERQRDYVNKSREAAASLLTLLNDILDYSKIEAGKLQLDVHPFSLDEVMRNLAAVLSGNYSEKPVEVLFDIDHALPETLMGDRNRLQQILINLAGNALKFTTAGYVIVRVEPVGQPERAIRLRISVEDTGIGISAENQQRIFDGFTQAEVSTSRRFGGTGLGLVISKRLLALMDSELHLRSEPGKGSCFWFELDLPVVDVRPPLRQRSESALRVLLIDNNPLSAQILQRDGCSLGWQMDIEPDADVAYEAMIHADQRGAPYQVVLLNNALPDKNGNVIARSLRAQFGDKTPPLILLCFYGREVLDDMMSGAASLFNEVLCKPVTPLQLSDAVMRVLRSPHSLVAEGEPEPDLRRLRGMRILVVEDNEINREIAFELLSAEGAIVDLADGGLSGVQTVLAAEHSFDAVIMDMQMPDIDGLEATRRIRADGRFNQLPILAMTANVSASDREACLRAGMNDHVGKPIDLDDVVHSLLRLTDAMRAEH
ncbi:MAG: PAS domain S-box protein [Saccharospirillaceae bacterium]|nr:PAS domain S-box protein [Saccharospirillaceae bacterium]MCD8530410.1 PAS domain S-box protein [Saccharospirillaceae bacterium]